jgi:hypothetical protein
MYPINQVFLNDTLRIEDIEYQLKQLEDCKKRLTAYNNTINNTIWNDIDKEISVLSDTQKAKLFEDREYVETYNNLQSLVQSELLNLVKSKIESSVEGKTLLEKQLSRLKELKKKITEDSENELRLFNKFKEFSKDNPSVTYEEFIKTITL